MAYGPEKITEVIVLTVEGLAQEEIEQKTGVSVRTQRNWKHRGLLDPDSSIALPASRPAEQLAKPEDATEKWPDITAADLVQAGFVQDVTQIIMAALSITREQGNTRLPRFLKSVLETK